MIFADTSERTATVTDCAIGAEAVLSVMMRSSMRAGEGAGFERSICMSLLLAVACSLDI